MIVDRSISGVTTQRKWGFSEQRYSRIITPVPYPIWTHSVFQPMNNVDGTRERIPRCFVPRSSLEPGIQLGCVNMEALMNDPIGSEVVLHFTYGQMCVTIERQNQGWVPCVYDLRTRECVFRGSWERSDIENVKCEATNIAHYMYDLPMTITWIEATP